MVDTVTQVQVQAQMGELTIQRATLGDRAANMAGELAVTRHQLQIAQERIAELEKQLQEKTDASDSP